jgi:hypothetical protein
MRASKCVRPIASRLIPLYLIVSHPIPSHPISSPLLSSLLLLFHLISSQVRKASRATAVDERTAMGDGKGGTTVAQWELLDQLMAQAITNAPDEDVEFLEVP